jgi:Protein of unknown function (DUF4242)
MRAVVCSHYRALSAPVHEEISHCVLSGSEYAERAESLSIALAGIERSVMALFVIERNFADQLNLELLDHAAIKLVNDDVGVRWVYSFLSADRKRTYCLYEAPNEQALREAAERLGIPADVIVSVEQFGPVPVS